MKYIDIHTNIRHADEGTSWSVNLKGIYDLGIRHTNRTYMRWKPRGVIVLTFLSLISAEIVCMTTHDAAGDDKVDIMANVDFSDINE